MYYDVFHDYETGLVREIIPTKETYASNLYCPVGRPCDIDCKEYKCDRFWGEVINCKNCAVRDNEEKCPVAKYYKTKDTDCCAWHVRKEK